MIESAFPVTVEEKGSVALSSPCMHVNNHIAFHI